MKSTAVMLTIALGLAPALGLAQQTTPASTPSQEPEAGGVAQGALPIFGSLPAGTFVVGGFIVLGATGVIVGVLGNEDTPVAVSATTTTN